MKLVGSIGAEVELPYLRTREAMRWAVSPRVVGCCGARAEPGKDDRDTTPNRFAGRERGLLRQEEHGSLVRRLPGGDVCALKVELAGARWRSNARADESTVFVEGEDAWDGEGGVELVDGLHEEYAPRAPHCILGHRMTARVGLNFYPVNAAVERLPRRQQGTERSTPRRLPAP